MPKSASIARATRAAARKSVPTPKRRSTPAPARRSSPKPTVREAPAPARRSTPAPDGPPTGGRRSSRTADKPPADRSPGAAPNGQPRRLSVAYRPLAELIPYARNARTHSEAQVGQLVESIKAFGWTVPILVDGSAGIIAGHARVLAAEQLGIESVPTIELSHLTEIQRRAYTIADNKLALNAGWDQGLLRLELTDLQALDPAGMPLVGFSDEELRIIFAGGETTPPADFEAYAEDIEIEHECPKCGYKFSGGRTADKAA